MASTISPERALKLSLALKEILEKGDLGDRAKATDNPFVPGKVIDLIWQIIFGKSKEESLDEPGAAFVLALAGKQPIMGWHLNNVPPSEVITLLATTVALVGQRIGRSILAETIQALMALKEREEVESATDGKSVN